MSSTTLRGAAALASIALLPWLGLPAHAQAVHKCRIDGRSVFQSAPCPLEARSVATAAPVVAVDPGGAAKKKGLAELLRERDQADATPARAREPQSDGANVLRSRMGAI